MKNFFRQRLKRIEWAWSGLLGFFRSGTHARIQGVSTILVVIGGWFFAISPVEWMLVLISIALVVQAEIINTVLEDILDFVHPDLHPRIKVMKDMSAAAVFWGVLTALAIGAIVFLPKVLGG